MGGKRQQSADSCAGGPGAVPESDEYAGLDGADGLGVLGEAKEGEAKEGEAKAEEGKADKKDS